MSSRPPLMGRSPTGDERARGSHLGHGETRTSDVGGGARRRGHPSERGVGRRDRRTSSGVRVGRLPCHRSSGVDREFMNGSVTGRYGSGTGSSEKRFS